MKTIWTVIQTIFAALGGVVGWFLGGGDGLLYALIAFCVVDYITGVMCAIMEKKLSSQAGFKGLCRKILIFILVGVGNVLDTKVFKTGPVVRNIVIFFYLSNEGISLLENASRIGLPVPEKLKQILAQLHDKEDDHEDHA